MMSLSGETNSPDPGGLWNLVLRYDEIPVLEAAVEGRRLSADQADAAASIGARLEGLRLAIERQASDVAKR